MKIKVSEAKDTALDYLAAKCENYPVSMSKTGFLIFSDPLIQCGPKGTQYSPSTIWNQGGPIIERERIAVDPDAGDNQWAASTRDAPCYWVGPTPLIAAMRCYCCAKLGEFVDIPEELCQQESN